MDVCIQIYICTHTHSYQVCIWVRRYYQDAAFPRSRVRSSAQHGSRIDGEKRVRKRNIETRVRMNYTPMHSNCPCSRALGPARSKPPRVNRADLSPPPRPPAPPLPSGGASNDPTLPLSLFPHDGAFRTRWGFWPQIWSSGKPWGIGNGSFIVCTEKQRLFACD